jgi:hypothetical protein
MVCESPVGLVALPPLSGVVGVNDQLPLPSAWVDPIGVLPS